MMIHRQRGYIDNQLAPVIFGSLLLAGYTRLITGPENPSPGISAIQLLPLILFLGIMGLGLFNHIEARRFPESPFNRHGPTLFIAVITLSAIAYSAWLGHTGGHPWLAYLFAAIAAVILLLLLYGAARDRNRYR